MTVPYRSLTRAEARTRRALLEVDEYDVRLDLSGDDRTFTSTTTIRFRSAGGPTFVDLKPARLVAATLDGTALDVAALDRGRLPLDTSAGAHELVVEAVMAYRNDGEGLHRSVDPADGLHYVYGMSFMDAAPHIFACFDQPDLKAPYTLHVTAPPDWHVVGNSPATQVEPGVWELERTPPLATYFVTVVAGPWHVLTDTHDGIPLGLSARRSIASDLDADAEELFTITRQCFDEFHRLFGIRYAFGGYHQAFVPEFNAGAMENPGCITLRDPMIFTSRVTRGERITRATTIAHEMAHQWFGNLVTPVWWDDLWLNESFAEYMGQRVTADVTEYADAWTHDAYVRRPWGLVADQRPSTHPVAGNGALDASSALQDFDGISYAKGSSVLKQLAASLGDEVFLAGVVDHFEGHRFGNATMHDLFAAWERAGGRDLGRFTDGWLLSAGADALALDREGGALLRTPPVDHPADREHTLEVAAWGDGQWRRETVTLCADRTPYTVPEGAVVLDAGLHSWGLVQPDTETLEALAEALPATTDPILRAAIWDSVRTAHHDAAIDPAVVLALIEAALPTEESDLPVGVVLQWALRRVAPLTPDPAAARSRLHAVAAAIVSAAEPGSTLQLSGFQVLLDSAGDPDRLRAWLDGDTPAGIGIDLDLRWRGLVRLAALGGIDRAALDAELDAEPTARSRVEHARAAAALPEPEAKAWAWQRFTGEVDVPNYELEAAGLGMWQWGQEELTAPYVERYFTELPATEAVRSGWMLVDAADAFAPLTSLDDSTIAAATGLAADEGLDAGLRRALVDLADELRRRAAVRRAFP